jgi:hypothetical protein
MNVSAIQPTPESVPETEPESGPRPAGGGRAPRVVFVGGTGRSGTHVVAKLLGRHRLYRYIPIECRFHVEAGGFPDLLAGNVSHDQFVDRLSGRWWRHFQTSRFRGLFRIVPRDRFDQAVAEFERAYPSDHEEACRQLFWALLRPLAREESKRGVVEQSCDTIAAAPTLLSLFPDARFIHVVRDGRNVIASRVSQLRWIVPPRTLKQGLEWWEGRMLAINAGAASIPPGRLLTVSLEELIEGRPSVREIRAFLGVGADRRMRRYHRLRMSGERAGAARWRDGLSARRLEEFNVAYLEALGRLEREGLYCAPLLRELFERET